MRIDPEIAALRSDKASQRLLQTKMAEAHAQWSFDPVTAAILADLTRYSRGVDLHELGTLQDVMTSRDQATSVINAWIGRFAAVLRDHLLAQLPFRHHHADGFTSMQLASIGGAALSLSLYAAGGQVSTPTSVLFSDREMHDLVVCGAARVTIYDLMEAHGEGTAASIAQQTVSLEPGSTLRSLGNCQTRQFDHVDQRMVVLQLSRVPTSPALSREYSLETGKLLLQSCGDKQASQQEMAMAVLCALGRSDAAPPLVEMTRHGPKHLRWQALRHVLALNAEQGFAALEAIAGNPQDSLAAPARELRHQLLTQYPQLAQRNAAWCHA